MSLAIRLQVDWYAEVEKSILLEITKRSKLKVLIMKKACHLWCILYDKCLTILGESFCELLLLWQVTRPNKALSLDTYLIII